MIKMQITALYFGDDKVFGIFALIPFEIGVYLTEISLAVARWNNIFLHVHFLLLIVHSHEYYGKVSIGCNDIKPQVPLGVCLSGTFRGEREAECVTLLGYVDKFCYECSALSSVYRYSSHPIAENIILWPNKPFFLHYKSSSASDCSVEKFA